MKKTIITSLHLAYWFIYLFLIFSISIIVSTSHGFKNSLPSIFLFFLLGSLCFYAFYWVLVPAYLASRRTKLFFISAVAVCMIASLITILFQIMGTKARPALNPTVSSASTFSYVITWSIVFIFYTFLGLINGVIATFMKGFISWYNEIHIKEVVARKNLQTELALVKAQIHPHFLFNTLNNIDILIEKNAQHASMYLKKLSDIMRFMLHETREEKISIEQELLYIQKYIDLQNIRTTNEDFISYEVKGIATGLTIAPMLFITFIENAFKYSTNKKIKNAITIKIDLDRNKISFFCKNIINQEKTFFPKESGLGLELTKQRLLLLYKDQHELHINRSDNYFEVSLTLYNP